MAFSGSVYTAAPDLDDPQAVEGLVRSVESSADPYAAYTQLTPEEKAAFDEHLKVASVEVESTSAANAPGTSANGCGVNSYSVKGNNLVGYTVWKFSTRTTWCWNGTEITNDPHFTTDGDVYYLFWSYEGTTYEEETGGEGDWAHQGLRGRRVQVLHRAVGHRMYPVRIPRHTQDPIRRWWEKRIGRSITRGGTAVGRPGGAAYCRVAIRRNLDS